MRRYGIIAFGAAWQKVLIKTGLAEERRVFFVSKCAFHVSQIRATLITIEAFSVIVFKRERNAVLLDDITAFAASGAIHGHIAIPAQRLLVDFVLKEALVRIYLRIARATVKALFVQGSILDENIWTGQMFRADRASRQP